jgi:putative ABC transport system ATP-binding protein
MSDRHDDTGTAGDAAAPGSDRTAQAAGIDTLLDAPTPDDDHMIHVRGLRKRYRIGKNNFVDALRGASLDVRRGEMAAIMGPSGSGKSTMLHIVGCLDIPDDGEVWLDGKRVDTLRGRALTRLRGRDIGFIFQGFNLIPTLSALDNISLAAEYAGRSRSQAIGRAKQLLELVGLADRMRHFPSELSGGQQQRVAIARALANEPTVILGDEPTGDLDTGTSEEIVTIMREINTTLGTTFLLVTHNPEVARACDRTIRMRDGVIVDYGDDEPPVTAPAMPA